MDTIGFKKESGDPSFTEFSGWVTPDYDIEDTEYTDINDTYRRVVDVVHLAFKIRFGMLTVTQQDFLTDLKAEAAPQMEYDSTTYNIKLERQNIRHLGAAMEVIKREKET